MSLSKAAKRGISIFNHIREKTKSSRFHRKMMTIDLNAVPPADPKLVSAATEAMGILVKNGEEANAKLSSVPNEEINADAPSAEGGEKPGVSEEPKVG
jgi:uncharacterized protein YacL